MSTEQKQQHYIPCCYSKFFANNDGYLHLRDTWEGRTFPSRPQNALKQSYIYRQPVHAENRFDNAMENFFSRRTESSWPSLVELIASERNLSRVEWGKVIEFYLAMRVRVPNTIKGVITLLKEHVAVGADKVSYLALEGLKDIFLEQNPGFSGEVKVSDLIRSEVINVSIDPHRALISLEKIIRNMDVVTSFNETPQFIHNKTAVDFISSDNPAIFHNSTRYTYDIRPYTSDRHTSKEIIFPITPRVALLLNTGRRYKHQHKYIFSENTVKAINEKVHMYADRYLLAKSPEMIENPGDLFIKRYPIPEYSRSVVGDGIVHNIAYKFGEPLKVRNRWNYPFEMRGG